MAKPHLLPVRVDKVWLKHNSAPLVIFTTMKMVEQFTRETSYGPHNAKICTVWHCTEKVANQMLA